MRRSLLLVSALALALTGLVATPSSSSAHTPNISADCSGVVLKATNYDGSKANRWSVTVDGVTQSGTFGSSFNQTFPVPQAGATTAWSAVIEAFDGSYHQDRSGSVGPCGTPPPPHDECPNIPGDQPAGYDCTPVSPEEPEQPCPCPALPVSGGKNLHCDGTYRGIQVKNVYVARGRTCVIHNSTVTGSVRSDGGQHVKLYNTAVKNRIDLNRIRGQVIIGVKGCKVDPYVGRSITVRNSRNVAICQQTVCHDIILTGNYGRVRVRDNTARLLRVSGTRAVRDEKPADAVRIVRNDLGALTLENNKRRVVKYGNRIG